MWLWRRHHPGYPRHRRRRCWLRSAARPPGRGAVPRFAIRLATLVAGVWDLERARTTSNEWCRGRRGLRMEAATWLASQKVGSSIQGTSKGGKLGRVFCHLLPSESPRMMPASNANSCAKAATIIKLIPLFAPDRWFPAQTPRAPRRQLPTARAVCVAATAAWAWT
jgi:hypothetical protein